MVAGGGADGAAGVDCKVGGGEGGCVGDGVDGWVTGLWDGGGEGVAVQKREKEVGEEGGEEGDDEGHCIMQGLELREL